MVLLHRLISEYHKHTLCERLPCYTWSNHTVHIHNEQWGHVEKVTDLGGSQDQYKWKQLHPRWSSQVSMHSNGPISKDSENLKSRSILTHRIIDWFWGTMANCISMVTMQSEYYPFFAGGCFLSHCSHNSRDYSLNRKHKTIRLQGRLLTVMLYRLWSKWTWQGEMELLTIQWTGPPFIPSKISSQKKKTNTIGGSHELNILVYRNSSAISNQDA